MINITFPDQSVRQYESGVTPLQIAESISPRLAQDILAASVNDQEWDIARPVTEDATIRFYKWDDVSGCMCRGRRGCCSRRFFWSRVLLHRLF